MATIFQRGEQVTVYSGPNVVSCETGQPFWYPAIVTAGPFPINTGGQGYYTLGVGAAEYPFDQSCHRAEDLRPADEPREDLTARYEAFIAWAYPNGMPWE